LLFRDIEKNTPAIDCPDTNRLLEKVRHRLDEAVHQVNVANSDAPKVRERIEKTWLLQDRLDFQQKVRDLGTWGRTELTAGNNTVASGSFVGPCHPVWNSARYMAEQYQGEPASYRIHGLFALQILPHIGLCIEARSLQGKICGDFGYRAHRGAKPWQG